MTQTETIYHRATAVFDGFEIHEGLALAVEDGQVVAHADRENLPGGARVVDHDGVLSPGYFDIQVNGGGGVLFNSSPDVDGISRILNAHRTLGTTALLPTVITDAPEVLEKSAQACVDGRDLPGMMGIHIEGPHISKTKRGTHAARFVRSLDDHTLGVVSELCAEGLPVLITIAPEAAPLHLVEKLVAKGAVVSIGHSDASAAEVEPYLDAGVTCFTHLFNAMSQMEGRAPGVVGAGLSSDVWCSIIADGHHVTPQMIRLACRARPRSDRMIAVSDAMPTVGGPEGFELYGNIISVKDGRLVNSEGALAGAHLSMAEAVSNLIQFGISEKDALRMGRKNPAELLGIWPKMGLVGARSEDILLLNPDWTVQKVGL